MSLRSIFLPESKRFSQHHRTAAQPHRCSPPGVWELLPATRRRSHSKFRLAIFKQTFLGVLMKSRILAFFCAALFVAAFSVSAFAQTAPGTLKGQVSDPSGAVVVGASVTATSS